MTYWLKYLLKEPYHAFRTPQSREMMRLFFRYGNAPRYRPTQVRFGKHQFAVPDAFSFLWQFKEIFVDEFYRFDTSENQPVIFDCGANVGSSVLYFKKIHPQARIVAFEADEQIAQYLHKNIQQNSIEGVEVIEKAVWTNDEGVNFGSEGADGASIFAEQNQRIVPSTRLRDWILREPRIDFLKIDIEGAETAVLPDCADALGHVQNLFLEYHAYLGQPQELGILLNILTKSGFRYYIDTNQHRRAPFVNQQYRDNGTMDLQLNIFAYR